LIYYKGKIMKSKIPILIFVFSLILFCNWVAGPETIAVIVKTQGSITLIRSKTASKEKITRGTKLRDGDKLVTKKKSYAAVSFLDDASFIRIRPNSTCIIRGKKEKNKISKNIFLEVGMLFARVLKQKGQFLISTPTSVASVKGTEWITEQKFEGGTFYYGIKGVVEITNDAGSALLHENESAWVASEKEAPVISKIDSSAVPSVDEDDKADLFELEFENDAGQKKLLKYNAIKKE
jgi:hypothetical protein